MKMRLVDIQVDEVSLVDKAANKKVFSFIKRDEAVAKAEAPVVAPVAATPTPETKETSCSVATAAQTPVANSQPETKAQPVPAQALMAPEFSEQDLRLIAEINATCIEVAASL